MDAPDFIYKIVTLAMWNEAEKAGVFKGAPVDLADGYIHFSQGDQVRETAARHFAGKDNLLLVTVKADALGEALVYEPSRGGQLFPHLYADLSLEAVHTVQALPLDAEGRHQFPVDVSPTGRSGGPTRR